MAKKVTLETLKIQLGELEGKEQTAEVMAEVDELKGKISDLESTSLPEKKSERNSPFIICEEWKLEKKFVNGKEVFERLKKIKETKLLKEQIFELNSQKGNSLIEYVMKEA